MVSAVSGEQGATNVAGWNNEGPRKRAGEGGNNPARSARKHTQHRVLPLARAMIALRDGRIPSEQLLTLRFLPLAIPPRPSSHGLH